MTAVRPPVGWPPPTRPRPSAPVNPEPPTCCDRGARLWPERHLCAEHRAIDIEERAAYREDMARYRAAAPRFVPSGRSPVRALRPFRSPR